MKLSKATIQRANRKSFTFGNAWLNAVLAGVAADHAKLVAHGVKLNAGVQNELAALDLETLISKVQAAV